MESSTLLHRLERLEKRNQVLTRVLVLGGTMVAALLAIAACSPDTPVSTSPPQDSAAKLSADILTVKGLILTDDQGRTAARLAWKEGYGTSLTFYSENGDEAVKLTAKPNGSGLTLYANGNRRVDLEAEDALGISTLRLFDNEQRVAVQAGHEGGATTLFLMGDPDERGLRPQLGLVMPFGNGMPHIRKRDPAGNVQLWGIDQ